jgi:hypothetical protein
LPLQSAAPVSKAWKNWTEKFQGLEKGAAIFPGIGKISGGISKDWKP